MSFSKASSVWECLIDEADMTAAKQGAPTLAEPAEQGAADRPPDRACRCDGR